MQRPRFNKIIGMVAMIGLFLPFYQIENFQLPATSSSSVEVTTASSVVFIENAGQFPDGARFQMIGANGTLWLADEALWLAMTRPEPDGAIGPGDVLPGQSDQDFSPAPSGVNLKFSFIGASAHPRLEPFDRQEVRVSYLVGSDPSNWRASVPVWGGVRYVGLYPGIDLVLIGAGDGWSWRLVCTAGECSAGLPDIRLRVQGAESLELSGDSMKITTEMGAVTLPLLAVESRLPGRVASIHKPSPGVYEVAHPFSQPSQPLIAPREDNTGDLLYSTFLGGNNTDYGSGIAVDSSGAVYISGRTESTNFPTTPGALDTTHNSIDGFVVKVAPGGGSLVYATFLGGSVTDEATGIAVDDYGAAYVTGYTYSTNFPTTAGAFDTTYNGSVDAFAVKLSPDGSALSYGTFLGGSGPSDRGAGIALDDSEAAYIHGYTSSSDFPTTPGAFDTTHNGSEDAFIVKLAPDGSALTYSTFLGGSGMETAVSIAVDQNGAAYVSGSTDSANFPTTPGSFDTTHNGGLDAYVGKLAPSGNLLAYSTYLGGSVDDQAVGIALDDDGAAYVTGSADSSGFPTTPAAFDTTHNGGRDAFVSKVASGGGSLVYSTFLGGSASDSGLGLAVNDAGIVYVAGRTGSANFPITPGAYDTTHNGNNDVFMLKVASDGSSLVYSSFLGGSNSDYATRLAVEDSGIAYLTGRTESSTFPTTAGAFDQTFGGSICGISPTYPCPDAFVARLAMGSSPPPTSFAYLPLLIQP